MGDPARSQCGLRRRHGRRAGNLPEAARSRSSSRVFGRDLQAIDCRDARSDPAQARTTRSSRLRIPAQRRRQSLHDIRAAGGLAPRGSDCTTPPSITRKSSKNCPTCISPPPKKSYWSRSRIPDKQTLEKEVVAWQSHRNKHHAKADWQFTTENARVKLKRLYPQFE